MKKPVLKDAGIVGEFTIPKERFLAEFGPLDESYTFAVEMDGRQEVFSGVVPFVRGDEVVINIAERDEDQDAAMALLARVKQGEDDTVSEENLVAAAWLVKRGIIETYKGYGGLVHLTPLSRKEKA